MPKNRLMPVAGLVRDDGGIFTESQVRGWIRNRAYNGFSQCIVRPSQRRLYINVDAFERWLEGQTEKMMEVSV
jgi:hypothetical protein